MLSAQANVFFFKIDLGITAVQNLHCLSESWGAVLRNKKNADHKHKVRSGKT